MMVQLFVSLLVCEAFAALPDAWSNLEQFLQTKTDLGFGNIVIAPDRNQSCMETQFCTKMMNYLMQSFKSYQIRFYSIDTKFIEDLVPV